MSTLCIGVEDVSVPFKPIHCTLIEVRDFSNGEMSSLGVWTGFGSGTGGSSAVVRWSAVVRRPGARAGPRPSAELILNTRRKELIPKGENSA